MYSLPAAAFENEAVVTMLSDDAAVRSVIIDSGVLASAGKTNLIERFNNTLRQQVGRLVRKTLSFSKKLSNHIGAIWYFGHHYNTLLLL